MSRWAPSLGGGPDAAHSSWDIPEGTGVGECRNPSDPASQGLEILDNGQSGKLIDKNITLRLKFRVVANRGHDNINDLPGWEAILWKGRLYVSVSPHQLNDGSKEAFVTLLEYAEETLNVDHVIICVDRYEKEAKSMIRNFLFLGFQPLAAGHEYLPSNPNLICFVYNI